MKKLILTISVCVALGGCAASRTVPDPVGIGTGTYELKKSPCACLEVPMQLPGQQAHVAAEV